MDKPKEIKKASSKSFRCGLIGERLSHSFSKLVHEQLCDYKYELIEIEKDALHNFLARREFDAINVTIPYKQTVIPYLYFIDEKAQKIGAVNTIVNKNGKLYGYNTDYAGVLYMLKRAGISLLNQTVLILGNGGTCKTLKAVCADEGAKEIIVASRKGDEDTISYETAKKREDITVILNASPVGMYPDCDACPIDLSCFPEIFAVADVIYNPLKTRLLLEAEKRLLKTAGGLSMLVSQAKYAAEYFLGEEENGSIKKAFIPEEKTDEILASLSLKQSNLVLIGMPGCGKSRIGRELACLLLRPFIDLDDELEKSEGRLIPQIFKDDGEELFRTLEADIIKRFAKEHGAVISTGGGCVLNKENMLSLSQNGVICFIDRPPERLPVGGKRPLSTGAETIIRMLKERLPLYKKYSDFTVLNDGDIEDTISEIKNKFILGEN